MSAFDPTTLCGQEHERDRERQHDQRRHADDEQQDAAPHGELAGRCHQPDADAAHAVQVARRGGGLAELAAQPRQVDVDGAVRTAPGQLPDLAEQIALADDLAGAAGQREQQLELLAGQLDRTAVDGHLVAAGVDDEPADGDHRVLVGASHPPQHGPDARVELRGGERLDHVVVGAEVEHAHHLGLVVARGGDDHRHVADGAQHRQDVGAVDVGQAEIEQHDVGLRLDRGGQRGQARADRGHAVPVLAQRAGEGGADRGVVLDEQHLHHARDGTATILGGWPSPICRSSSPRSSATMS